MNRLYIRTGVAALAGLAMLLTTGCRVVKQAYQPNPEPHPPVPVMPEAIPPQVDVANLGGSLYPSEGYWSLYSDTKAFRRGDLVRVIVRQKNEGKKNATTSTEREASISGSIRRFFGFEDEIQEATTDDPELISVTSQNEFAGTGSTERKDDLTATISTVVTDVLANGNLVVYGNQIVTVNNEASVLTVQGIIRPYDIAPDNTIESNRIANANIEFAGSGVVTDKQHPGWAMRIFDWLWPI
jgi:flagellar L-ring protein precursor FlgH